MAALVRGHCVRGHTGDSTYRTHHLLIMCAYDRILKLHTLFTAKLRTPRIPKEHWDNFRGQGTMSTSCKVTREALFTPRRHGSPSHLIGQTLPRSSCFLIIIIIWILCLTLYKKGKRWSSWLWKDERSQASEGHYVHRVRSQLSSGTKI